MLDAPERKQWSENGIRYGQEEDLYSMPDIVADTIERFAESRNHSLDNETPSTD